LFGFCASRRDGGTSSRKDAALSARSRQALGGLLCLGRRTLSRILFTNGREQKPWAADYHLHSRCSWEPQALFDPILKEALLLCHGRLVPMAMDDTGLREARAADPCALLSLRPHRIENAKAAGSTIGSQPIC
jgi:hypothetical protein